MKGEQKQELKIKDLLYKVLRSWRMVIVWTLVTALLLSGMKLALDVKNAAAQPTVKVVSVEELREQLTDEQLIAVDQAIALQHSVNQMAAHATQSLYFEINPFEEHLLALYYYVDVPASLRYQNGVETALGQELVRSYTDWINNHLVEVFGDQANLYNEVVKAEVLDESDYQFSVAVKGATKEKVQSVEEQVKSLVELAKKELASVSGHTLTLVSESYSVVVDDYLKTEKKQYNTLFNELQKELTTEKGALSSTQLRIFNAEFKPEESKPVASKPQVSFSVKYLILGAGMGFALSVLYLALMYMLGSRLRKQEELDEIYGLPSVGTFTCSAQKRVFSAVDKFIVRLFAKGTRTKEEQLSFAVSNIRYLCEKHGVGSLSLITNLHLNGKEKALMEQLTKALEEQSITLTVAENFRNNLPAYEAVRQQGLAVVLEKVNVSTYEEIEKQLELCKQGDITLLGSIVLEA